MVPGAAIVELLLPGGDGIELCRRLRQWSAMPLIVLTAPADEGHQPGAFEAGADDYAIDMPTSNEQRLERSAIVASRSA